MTQLTLQDLKNILGRLLENPPKTPEASFEEQKYLALALDEDARAELTLLAAENVWELTESFASADEISIAEDIFELVSLLDDHKLRGQIHFLKYQ